MPSIARYGAPPRFQNRTFADFIPVTITAEKALAAAKRFANGEIQNLVFVGSTGVGKSHLASAASLFRFQHDDDEHEHSEGHLEMLRKREAAMAWERVRDCRDEPHHPEWQNVAELIVGLRADMDREREERGWSERVDELATYRGVVVLDDLGREKVSDWTGETVYALVNRRYEYLLPTIVTTNLTGAELAASPYWPVISRLAEDGELVRIEAPDHRLERPK